MSPVFAYPRLYFSVTWMAGQWGGIQWVIASTADHLPRPRKMSQTSRKAVLASPS